MNERTALRVRRFGAVAALALTALLAGCGISIPSDPDGTLASVSGGELRVGYSPDPGLIRAGDGGDEPTGSLPDLVEGFAEDIHADVEWTEGSEETLVRMLERGDLDLVVGGMTDDSPWLDRAGMTRGYPGIDGADGRSVVMFVPLGENAFLSALEGWLDEEVGP